MIHKRKIPYGYMMRRGQTVINENEAQTVRKIFGLSASGISGGEILQQLGVGNDDYWNDEKNKLLDKVYGILRKEYYCGNDDFPALITKKLFDKSREATRKRDHVHSPNQTKVPIKYVFCAVCGSPFIRGRKISDIRWRCRNLECQNHKDGIRENDLNFQLTAILQRVQADILFEILSDQSIEMLTEKAANMIKIYPYGNDTVSIESIKNGFQWLYGTVEDETIPVSTELFRSSFNNAIHMVCSRQHSHETITEFLCECYNEYMKDINGFLLYFDALVTYDSGICNESQNKYADIFLTYCRPIFEEYTKKCSKRQKGDISVIWAFNITSFMDLLVYIYSRLSHEHRNVKICSNCGRYFIPLKRSDEKYCSNKSKKNQQRPVKRLVLRKNSGSPFVIILAFLLTTTPWGSFITL